MKIVLTTIKKIRENIVLPLVSINSLKLNSYEKRRSTGYHLLNGDAACRTEVYGSAESNENHQEETPDETPVVNELTGIT